ncbi:hypothetical protein AALO_G00038520 [Alosa alosa]|uniref:Uncharacterized protein n=1 Tax=Alosa alosa TaxID=278164 RepID=A0AAV6HBB9_9TELE|nr:hypothetical protein AALO_G00038520 [Alosa alosa]
MISLPNLFSGSSLETMPESRGNSQSLADTTSTLWTKELAGKGMSLQFFPLIFYT